MPEVDLTIVHDRVSPNFDMKKYLIFPGRAVCFIVNVLCDITCSIPLHCLVGYAMVLMAPLSNKMSTPMVPQHNYERM